MINFPVLLIWIDPLETELKQWYMDAIKAHNDHVLSDPYPDSGFDLAFPSTVSFEPSDVCKVDFKIKAMMGDGDDQVTAFYLLPRSSIAKTPLMLANQVGLIDAGYRGSLIGAFRHLGKSTFQMETHSRLLQIAHPALKPFLVYLTHSEEELGTTLRGGGGFGSTG